MLINDARREARFADGELILLRDQDRTGSGIEEQLETGRRSLEVAVALGGRGPYVLQAAIAALHVEDPVGLGAGRVALRGAGRRSPARTWWSSIAPSPLRRRVTSRTRWRSPTGSKLDRYHYLHATRAELLSRLGRVDEARAAYDRGARTRPRGARAALSRAAPLRARDAGPLGRLAADRRRRREHPAQASRRSTRRPPASFGRRRTGAGGPGTRGTRSVPCLSRTSRTGPSRRTPGRCGPSRLRRSGAAPGPLLLKWSSVGG